MKNIQVYLDKLKKAFVKPNKIDPSKFESILEMQIAMTLIDKAMKKGEITEKQILSYLSKEEKKIKKTKKVKK